MEVQGIPTWTGQGEVKPAKVPEEQQWVAGGGGAQGEEENLDSVVPPRQGNGVSKGSIKWNYCFN